MDLIGSLPYKECLQFKQFYEKSIYSKFYKTINQSKKKVLAFIKAPQTDNKHYSTHKTT